jgi:hypothetical protein
MVNGVQPATFFLLPMLGKHPDEYPRFRDCFAGKQNTDEELDQFGIPVHKHGDEALISVYTRVGGGNRDDYDKEIKELQAMAGYVKDFDDDFDTTFATFVFKVPERFLNDFKLIKEGKIMETSKEYKAIVDKVYPKLKGKLPWHKKTNKS